MPPMLGEVGVRSMDIGRPMSIDIGRASDASSASAVTDICCCVVAPTCAHVRPRTRMRPFSSASRVSRISQEHTRMHQKISDTSGISTVMP